MNEMKYVSANIVWSPQRYEKRTSNAQNTNTFQSIKFGSHLNNEPNTKYQNIFYVSVCNARKARAILCYMPI